MARQKKPSKEVNSRSQSKKRSGRPRKSVPPTKSDPKASNKSKRRKSKSPSPVQKLNSFEKYMLDLHHQRNKGPVDEEESYQQIRQMVKENRDKKLNKDTSGDLPGIIHDRVHRNEETKQLNKDEDTKSKQKSSKKPKRPSNKRK